MAITDFDQYKSVDVTSVSGTPSVTKAAKVTLSDHYGINFEDGSKEGFDLSGGGSIVDGQVNPDVPIEGFYSLKHSPSGSLANSDSPSLGVQIDACELQMDITSGFSNNEDETAVSVRRGDGTEVSKLRFRGTGDIYVDNTDTGTDWQTGVRTVRAEIDYANNQIEWFVKGSSVGTYSTTSSISTFGSNTVYTDTSNSGSQRTVYFDEFKYFGDAKALTNLTGDIVIDWDSVSSTDDVAFYDGSSTLLDYEWEEFDAANNYAVAHIYNAWVRDGTEQLRVAHGNHSGDLSNTTAVWNNSGESPEIVQHLNSNVLDSTDNNHDGTVNGATAVSNGEFDGAYDFNDANDDFIDIDHTSNYSIMDLGNTGTVVVWFNFERDAESAEDAHTFSKGDEWGIHPQQQTIDDELFAPRFDVFGDNNLDEVSDSLEFDNWHLLVYTVDSGNEIKTYADGNLVGTTPTSDTSPPESATNLTIGVFENPDGTYNQGAYFNGRIDECRLYLNERKSLDWVEAEFAESDRGGQTFFTQQNVTVNDTAGSVRESTNTDAVVRTKTGAVVKTNP